ncbi:MAG: formylmethanofuran dehydrogenase subunit A [Methanosarcinales archaeon]|nr:MAG: formylmethanofuran dehydrogenase subunit A [Methanosarcinales archaeon]
MSELLIKNGRVFDPINSINGDIMDIAIKNGKIVDDISLSPDTKVIDASSMIVMPGGVDAHSHIAGSKVNSGRIMCPNDSRSGIEKRTKITRPCSGYTVPNTFAMGYRYAKLGYTTVFEAAIPILHARHTHEEFGDIPIIDKGGLVLFGSNWQVMEAVRENDIEKLAAYIAWGLSASRGYGVKIVNPGGGEAWGFGKNVSGLHDTVPNFDVTPAEIITGLAKANEMLHLPHSIHLHCNLLGKPGNYKTTIETMKLLENIKPSMDRQVVHITHMTFNAWGGTNWGDFESKADAVADYLNQHDHVTVDMGQLIFGNATTMTADGPMQYANARLLATKWTNGDVELEDASGVVPLSYIRKMYIHDIMWAVGLEVALLTKNPWQVLLTTDHPNGGPFVNYPEVIALLMSARKREEEMLKLSNKMRDRTTLSGIERELDWYDIAIKTRASHAKILGLTDHGKGHLGAYADADVTIYHINPDQVDAGREHATVKKAFEKPAYTIKDGEFVVRNGEITATPEGRTFWVNASVPEEDNTRLMKDLRLKFRKYYSINLANYMVQDNYVKHPVVIKAGGS